VLVEEEEKNLLNRLLVEKIKEKKNQPKLKLKNLSLKKRKNINIYVVFLILKIYKIS